MNNFQKVIKVFAICLAIFIITNICMLIFSGLALFTHIDNKNEPWKEFEAIYRNIDILDIDIAFSNIEIKVGNEFRVLYLTVHCLHIYCTAKLLCKIVNKCHVIHFNVSCYDGYRSSPCIIGSFVNVICYTVIWSNPINQC